LSRKACCIAPALAPKAGVQQASTSRRRARVRGGGLQRDHAAHAVADQHRALEAGRIEQLGQRVGVGAHALGRVGLEGLAGAVAGHVPGQRAPAGRGQPGQQLQRAGGAAADPVQKDQPARASPFSIQLGVIMGFAWGCDCGRAQSASRR
jgi:hypothetical protein